MNAHQLENRGSKRPSIGLLMSVCEGELEIGREALLSAIMAFGAENLSIQIIDDASESLVGSELANFCHTRSVEASCYRYEKPLGYRGCIARTLLGLSMLADHTSKLDCVVKIDADTLVIDPEFGNFVKQQCHQPDTLCGMIHTLRRRDLVLLLADLLPIGFRRKSVSGMIQRKWELSRLKPVWWTDIGWRAIFKRQPLNKIVTGGVYVIAGPLLRKIKDRGYLDRDMNQRYGFITSEEDTILSLMAKVAEGRIVDMNALRPNLGNMRIPANSTASDIYEAGYLIIHPLKANELHNRLREELKQTPKPAYRKAVMTN